jgi:DNA polymerase-3 subunit delta'
VSGLRPLIGHESVRGALATVAMRGNLAPALLFIGPPGVGKQRSALWLAQILLCDQPSTEGPCGMCRPCRLTLRLEHPDVNWFFPLARPRVSGGPEKLGEALEDARAAELESRRTQPWTTVPPDEPVGIYMAHAQVIRRVAGTRPAMARRKIIIIGDAEQLVPQEASPEAANALLKVLEEPPTDTTIIATTSDPEGLLPTVRSRLLPVRFSRLSQDVVAEYLRAAGCDEGSAGVFARLAEGSIGRALGFMPADDGSPGPLDAMRRRARAILESTLGGGGDEYLVPLAQPPIRARGDFSTMLAFVCGWLRDLAAVSAGAEASVVNIDSMDWLRRHAHHFADGSAVGGAIGDVEEVLYLTELNINPQLALRSVIHRIAARLQPHAATR